LRECSIKDGIALAGEIQIIAVDYRTFPQRLEIAVQTFAATGHLADLTASSSSRLPDLFR
jgi:hypothetical protein